MVERETIHHSNRVFIHFLYSHQPKWSNGKYFGKRDVCERAV